jgi:hypothetical protein
MFRALRPELLKDEAFARNVEILFQVVASLPTKACSHFIGTTYTGKDSSK